MIIANFTNNQDVRVAGLDQYDYGQVLRIQGLKLPTAVEIHFGLEETGGTTTTRIGVTKDGVTDVVIPDSMLENGDTSLDYAIYAFVYLTDETSGKTVRRIKIQVKARSKPEQFDRPSDTELFREAIKAVNQSAKEAEGWAHGREDMPERATDNAKYYAGESAKSAESVKGVEQNVKDMVATIGGIEQQVQDVKKYAGQAQSASEKALLSEQEAKKSEQASLQHRTGAETAENNAELAEQNAKKSEQAVEQAKTLVIQMGQQVLDNKNHVDGKVEAFNKVATDASDAINTKKTESLTEVETAKTNAVGAVGTKGTEQTKKVADEGTKQVGVVNTEAQKHLKAMQDAVNGIVADRQQITQNKEDVTTLKEDLKGFVPKNQGVENKDKILGIGADGMVFPVEKPSGGSQISNWSKVMDLVLKPNEEIEIDSYTGATGCFHSAKPHNLKIGDKLICNHFKYGYVKPLHQTTQTFVYTVQDVVDDNNFTLDTVCEEDYSVRRFVLEKTNIGVIRDIMIKKKHTRIRGELTVIGSIGGSLTGNNTQFNFINLKPNHINSGFFETIIKESELEHNSNNSDNVIYNLYRTANMNRGGTKTWFDYYYDTNYLNRNCGAQSFEGLYTGKVKTIKLPLYTCNGARIIIEEGDDYVD